MFITSAYVVLGICSGLTMVAGWKDKYIRLTCFLLLLSHMISVIERIK